jgi:phosphate transport system protein
MANAAFKKALQPRFSLFISEAELKVRRPGSDYGEELIMSLATSDHTTKAFDVDLQELKRLIAEMGGRVERQLHSAISALIRRDCEMGQRVVLTDAMLDALQQEIEEKAITTIATRQPMAVDLREVVAVLRIANDLERIGDLAKNIAKRVAVLDQEEIPRQARRGLAHMMDIAIGLLTDVLDAFVSADSAKAAAIRSRDEEIDMMYTSLFRELLTYMMEDSGIVAAGVHLLFCAKNIERAGDHVTNIAESVYYMVEGHTFAEERRKADTTSVYRAEAHHPH